jgi:enoyl-CoA hydratase/carnithine racemase
VKLTYIAWHTTNKRDSDIVFAAPSAKFGLPEVEVGLYAGAGGLSRLVRCAGLQVASEVALTGRHITAQEAFRWGLVNRISEAQSTVVSEAVSCASLIARKSPDAIIVSRAGLRQALETASVERATQITEQQYLHALTTGENFRIGLKAFAEKKAPQWIPSRL